MSRNPYRLNQRELARRLHVAESDAWAEADRRGVPVARWADGLQGGTPVKRPIYDRAQVEEFLLEQARMAAKAGAA